MFASVAVLSSSRTIIERVSSLSNALIFVPFRSNTLLSSLPAFFLETRLTYTISSMPDTGSGIQPVLQVWIVLVGGQTILWSMNCPQFDDITKSFYGKRPPRSTAMRSGIKPWDMSSQ